MLHLVRNPKSEIRRLKEDRNPKSEMPFFGSLALQEYPGSELFIGVGGEPIGEAGKSKRKKSLDLCAVE